MPYSIVRLMYDKTRCSELIRFVRRQLIGLIDFENELNGKN